MNLQRLRCLIRLDAKLAVRHRLLWVVIAVATVFGVLIRFAVPDQLESAGSDYIVDATPDGRFAAMLDGLPEDRRVADEAQLREIVADTPDALGVVFAGTPDAPRAFVLRQGHESDKRIALMSAGTDAVWASVGGLQRPSGYPTRVLDPDRTKPSLRDTMIPIMFTVDVCMLGFLFAAVMVMQEKEMGTVSFLRTTATTPSEYLVSKTAVNMAMVAVNVVILVGLVAPHYLLNPGMLAAVFLGGIVMTFVGIALATLFRNLSSFFYPMAIVGLLAAMPMYPYTTPGVQIPGVQWLPTHHVLFGADGAMFGSDALASLLTLAIDVFVAGVVATWLVRRRLFAEVR